MLIALLAILGVDLVVIIVFVALVVGRRRWLKRQPGEFADVIRVTVGDVDGLSPKWRRGSGRWVRDVLVWSKGPFLFRDVLVPVDRLSGERPAHPDEVKRLGDNPIINDVEVDDTRIEIAARPERRALIAAPFTTEPAPRRRPLPSEAPEVTQPTRNESR